MSHGSNEELIMFLNQWVAAVIAARPEAVSDLPNDLQLGIWILSCLRTADVPGSQEVMETLQQLQEEHAVELRRN